MGAALSRAQELISQCNIREVLICAINRENLCDYHRHCIEIFQQNISCKISVINFPFLTWMDKKFNILDFLDTDSLTIGVGSGRVMNKLELLDFIELESFG